MSTVPAKRNLSPRQQDVCRRLKKIWDEKKAERKFTQQDAAAAFGMKHPSGVGHYLTARQPVNTEAVFKFAEFLGVAPGDIDPVYGGAYAVERAKTVPLISWVSAGEWQSIEENVDFSDCERIDAPRNTSNQAFALRVVGDSMHNPSGLPTAPRGSVIVVDPSYAAEHGSLVVAVLEEQEETTFKRLVIEPPHKMLTPLNPVYPSIPVDENCRIIGVVRKIEYPL